MDKDKKAMRYAARLACIYDWTQGDMSRTPERMGRADCIEAIKSLGSLINNAGDETLQTAKDANNLWKQVSREFPGVGNKDIEESVHWVMGEILRVYDMQRREIEATYILNSLYENEGADLFPIADKCGVYKWTLLGWLRMERRISWKMVKSIENLESRGEPYTIYDAFGGMQEVFK